MPAVERRVPGKRTTELGLLLFGMVVVLAYAVAAEGGLNNHVRPDVWVQPAFLTLIFVAFHFVVRITAPYADR